MGTTNPGRYSNPAVDAKLRQALAHGRRRQARGAAGGGQQDRHEEDPALIPLHFELTPWAFKKGLSYTAAPTSTRWPMGVKPAQ